MEDWNFVVSRCLDNMPEDQKTAFNTAIHLIPQWKLATPIVHQHLSSLTTPLAKYKATHTSSNNKGVNHCIKESSYPLRQALCVGCVVMLLKNYVIEWKLSNGSVGRVVDIVYDRPEGPGADSKMPSFVVVDFPQCLVPEDEQQFPNNPTYVSIPADTSRCDAKCCSITMIPLRVCVAITIHKSQGMTVGTGEIFDHVVVHLPDSTTKRSPGLELVAFSRAKTENNIAIGNRYNTMVEERFKKIGKSPADTKRRIYHQYLKDQAAPSQEPTKRDITALDENVGSQTFEGGCNFLFKWFQQKCIALNLQM